MYNNINCSTYTFYTTNIILLIISTGLFIRPSDEANVYTTLEPTMSSNPNVYFQHGGGVHPGMMY